MQNSKTQQGDTMLSMICQKRRHKNIQSVPTVIHVVYLYMIQKIQRQEQLIHKVAELERILKENQV